MGVGDNVMRTLTAALALALLSATGVSTHAAPAIQRVIEMRKSLNVPLDWHFFLLNEAEWRDTSSPTHSAYSNLTYKSTFIREWYAKSATDSQLRQTIAHEMGHRICNCTDESKANFYQSKILTGEIQ